jgi:hypothetical protein
MAVTFNHGNGLYSWLRLAVMAVASTHDDDLSKLR